MLAWIALHVRSGGDAPDQPRQNLCRRTVSSVDEILDSVQRHVGLLARPAFHFTSGWPLVGAWL